MGDALSEAGATAGAEALLDRGRTGVYVGVSNLDYMKLAMRHGGAVSSYSATGRVLCVQLPGGRRVRL